MGGHDGPEYAQSTELNLNAEKRSVSVKYNWISKRASASKKSKRENLRFANSTCP
jgi:hypothetical protein